MCFYLLLITECMQVFISCRLGRHSMTYSYSYCDVCSDCSNKWSSGLSCTNGLTVWNHNYVMLFVICSHPVSHPGKFVNTSVYLFICVSFMLGILGYDLWIDQMRKCYFFLLKIKRQNSILWDIYNHCKHRKLVASV